MTTTDNYQPTDANESRLTLVLSHLGEGMVIGAVFYFGVAFVLFLFSRFFAKMVAGDRALFGFVAIVLLVIFGRFLVAEKFIGGTHGEKLEKWRRARDMRWMAALSVTVAVFLFGGTIFISWKALVTFFIPALLMNTVALVGFVLQIIATRVSEGGG